MTFETFVQSDEKTWHDQKNDKDKYKDKDNDKDKDILRAPPKSNPRDLWHLRYLFRVMRKNDMTKKKLTKTNTKTKTKTKTMTKAKTKACKNRNHKHQYNFCLKWVSTKKRIKTTNLSIRTQFSVYTYIGKSAKLDLRPWIRFYVATCHGQKKERIWYKFTSWTFCSVCDSLAQY